MSSIDDLAVYFFVRGDLREEDQTVQIAHAVLEMALTYDPALAKYRIIGLDGGQSEKAFNKTRQKLNNRGIAHVEYSDPDFPDWGVTAIATIPLTKEQALPLANYRLRRYSPPSVACAEVALDGQRGASFITTTQSGRTMCTAEATGMWPFNASVAQETEHSVSNREVVGAIPTGSSNL